jgi:hypothetical protein
MVVSAPQKNKLTEPSAVKPAGKNILLRLAPYLVWQLIALLVVECVLFAAGIGEEEIFKLDPVLGTRHMTNKRITWRSEGYAQSYFNEDGMRETNLTVAKPAGTYRVALLGDSMVEGLQVPLDQTFGQIMQARLQADMKQPVQVLNFGTSGYSTAQEYLQLKMQVMKYKPDLVLLYYNSRDIFENWSPADQTITNLRPIALHLPGGHLIVDSSPVLLWMHSSRARFLQRIDWLRQNSRIWGLISAQQTEWSFTSPIYRAISKIFSQPGVAIRELVVALLPKAGSAPSFNIAKFETTGDGSAAGSKSTTMVTDKTGNAAGHDGSSAANGTSAGAQQTSKQENVKEELISAAPNRVLANGGAQQPGKQEIVKEELISAAPNRVLANGASQLAGAKQDFNSAAPNRVLAKGAEQASAAVAKAAGPSSKAVDGRKTYIDLITRTESSLFAEMVKTCQQGNAKFAVLIIPVRSALCPAANMETQFLGIDYPGEIKMIEKICQDRSIPMFDDESVAAKLSADESPSLFYSVHLKPKGHEFVAETTYPFIHDIAAGKTSMNPKLSSDTRSENGRVQPTATRN